MWGSLKNGKFPRPVSQPWRGWVLDHPCSFGGGSQSWWWVVSAGVWGQEAMEVLIAWTGYSIKCEYTAHKEGVLKEEMLLACEGGAGTCVRVVVQARVMGEH